MQKCMSKVLTIMVARDTIEADEIRPKAELMLRPRRRLQGGSLNPMSRYSHERGQIRVRPHVGGK